MPWAQRLADPIPLPNGDRLVTLLDAGVYVASLPKAKQKLPHWKTATEILILVGDQGGDPMLARIGMMQAMNYGRTKW